MFQHFADHADAQDGWTLMEMETDASHNTHITVPEKLASLLHGIASKQLRE